MWTNRQRRLLGRRSGVCAALAIAVVAAVAGPQARAQSDNCDRACLQGFVDRYLEALVAHDAARAPFAAGAKYTENGQQLPLTQGLWQTASVNSTYRLYSADPQAGQVGFIGVIQENGSPVMIALRLKVANRQIAEAEMIASRVTQGGFARPDAFTQPNPLFLKPLSPEQRVPREQMIAAADAYFTGLDTEESGANVPFDPNCQRRENGAITANDPDPKAGAMQRLGCKAQFDTGFSVIVTDVRERRFPVIDEERGLVYSVIFFDHSGAVASYPRADGSVQPVTGAFRRPLTFMLGELFKLESGKIRQIEVVLLEVPYRMPSGWEEAR